MSTLIPEQFLGKYLYGRECGANERVYAREAVIGSIQQALNAARAELERAVAAAWQQGHDVGSRGTKGAGEGQQRAVSWQDAFAEARDAVLNQRGPLEGEGVDSTVINAVLDILDDAFSGCPTGEAVEGVPAQSVPIAVPGAVWGMYGEQGVSLIQSGTEDARIAKSGGERLYRLATGAAVKVDGQNGLK